MSYNGASYPQNFCNKKCYLYIYRNIKDFHLSKGGDNDQKKERDKNRIDYYSLRSINYVKNSGIGECYWYQNAGEDINDISFMIFSLNDFYQYQILFETPLTKTYQETLRINFKYQLGRKS